MLNTKEIVAAAVAAGATKVENVVIEGISFSKADKENVDYWATLRINQAVDVMREVDGTFKPQKGVTITVSNIGFIAMLREAFMRNTQLVPLVRFLNAIDADAKDIAAARKAGDTGATTPLIDLLLSAKINLLCRKVEKDTKVKSLFSLNEKESDVNNDSFWYDPYNLTITRINDLAYDFVIDANGMPQTITEPIFVQVMKRYVLAAKADEQRRAVAKTNGGFTSNLAARAAEANRAANNLPEE
jgi:hypothetical protein